MRDKKRNRMVSQAQQGDQQAIAALYDRHFEAVYNYIFYRVSDQLTAEDLSTEVFIRMLDNLPGYVDRGKPFLAWLYTIARNLVIDHYRAQEKLRPAELKEDQLQSLRPGPAQVVQEGMTRDCFRKALDRIPETQRQMLVHRFINGFSFQEITALLEKSDRALRSLQHRALRSLESALKEEDCL